MQQGPAVEVKAMVLILTIAAIMQVAAGQLAFSSRKTYAKYFAHWYAGSSLTKFHWDELVTYRAHLAETSAQLTAKRIWTIAQKLLHEVVRCGLLLKNSANAFVVSISSGLSKERCRRRKVGIYDTI